jgi:hypothetical protein
MRYCPQGKHFGLGGHCACGNAGAAIDNLFYRNLRRRAAISSDGARQENVNAFQRSLRYVNRHHKDLHMLRRVGPHPGPPTTARVH